MNIYTYTDTNTVTLTTSASSFNALLKHYLVPLGWVVVDEVGFVLRLKNAMGYIIKVKDINNKAYSTGFRSSSDMVGFPTSSQFQVDGEVGVVTSKDVINSWYLFANENMFYFVLNGELTAFGYYDPLLESDVTNYLIIGNQAYLGNQTLIVQPDEYSTLMFLEGLVERFPFALAAGLSLHTPVDAYPFQNSLLLASPIVVHDPNKQYIRGFLPDLFTFNQSFTHEGYIYSRGGYQLYCVIIDNRCFGVRHD